MNITIIGCGHGGQALAAHFSLLEKNTVTIYADDKHPGQLDKIENNTITVRGKVNGSANIHHLTKEIDLALRDAEIIYISLPTHAHLSQFRKMIPYLKKGQIVIALAGNFSSLYFHQELIHAGKEREVFLADISSLPYACRTNKAGEVDIIGIKNKVDIAAMPAKYTDYIIHKISSHFPSKLYKSSNILDLGLNITSAISHPSIMVMNAGRIGKGNEEFYFYKEGISKEIAGIVEAIDTDRIKIGKIYGLEMPSYLEIMNLQYSTEYKNYYDFFTHSAAHNKLKLCPSSVHDRYISQDVPYVMLPWFSLGMHVGYESKVMESLIHLSSLINNTCYFSKGRSVADDFFRGMDIPSVKTFLQHGVI